MNDASEVPLEFQSTDANSANALVAGASAPATSDWMSYITKVLRQNYKGSCSECSKLANQVFSLQQALATQSTLSCKIYTDYQNVLKEKQEILQELEDLTAHLFNEANEMVSKERESNFQLKERNQQLKKQLDALQKQENSAEIQHLESVMKTISVLSRDGTQVSLYDSVQASL